MTLAGIDIEEDKAEALIARFRLVTGYHGEVKGSRIDLAERALIFELVKDSEAQIMVGIAISALVPDKNADRGDHDTDVYAALLEDVVKAMLPDLPICGIDLAAAIEAKMAANAKKYPVEKAKGRSDKYTEL